MRNGRQSHKFTSEVVYFCIMLLIDIIYMPLGINGGGGWDLILSGLNNYCIIAISYFITKFVHGSNFLLATHLSFHAVGGGGVGSTVGSVTLDYKGSRSGPVKDT